MDAQDHSEAAELAAEIIAADRGSARASEESEPVGLAFSPLGLLLYPHLRRHRRWLLPVVVLCVGVAVLLAVVL